MARPLRIEYPGATYHVISRGNNREPIYKTKEDRWKFFQILQKAFYKFEIRIHAYCLMGNHYHLLIETPRANLQKSFQYINSGYSNYYNRKHKKTGHLLEGRYKALVVDKENYLLELTRYIHLNPLKARMVRKPEDYEWSSYRAFLGKEKKPSWLKISEILERFGRTKNSQVEGIKKFTEERMEEKPMEDPFSEVVYQCFLGGKDFIAEIKEKLKAPHKEVVHRSGLISLEPEKIKRIVEEEKVRGRLGEKVKIYFIRKYSDLTLAEISEAFGGGHYSRIGQIVKRLEKESTRNRKIKGLLDRIDLKMSNVKG